MTAMAETAPQIQYRDEYIQKFEQGATLLRDCVTTEAMVKGLQATFLTAGSGGAEAVTRSVTGKIPGRTDDNTQTVATLAEWHDKPVKTGFNIFQSQGNQRAMMQRTSLNVMNRKMDSEIITVLNTGTVNTGAAVTGSVALVLKATTILGNALVPWDGQIYGAITPAMYAYLAQTKEFSSKEYITPPRFETNDGAPNATSTGGPRMFRWLEVNWLVHPSLPGAGTNAEKCFIWHKDAVGHAVDTAGIQVEMDYNREDDYSWARTSVYMGSAKLQNSGIVVINHDGSAYVAA
jgi:hypothetical protein